MCGVFIFIVHIFALALDYFFFLYHYHFVLYGLYIDRRISVCYKCVTHIWIVHFRFASDWFSHFQTFYTWFWRTFYIFISSRSHYIFPSKFFEFSEALTLHTDDAWNMWICIGTMHETCEYHPRSDAFEILFGTNSKSSIEISGPHFPVVFESLLGWFRIKRAIVVVKPMFAPLKMISVTRIKYHVQLLISRKLHMIYTQYSRWYKSHKVTWNMNRHGNKD